MSSRRLGDSSHVTTLNPVVQAAISTAATVGGKPIAGCRAYKTGQITLAKPSVAGGGGADTLDCVLQDSPAPLNHASNNLYDGVDDGSSKLRDAGASNVEFGIPFTQGLVGCTIYSITLKLSKLGTPAKAGGGTPAAVWVSIETDTPGSPSNTTVGGLSKAVLCSAIGTTIQDVTFYFEIGVDLTAVTTYWVVIGGDYDVSLTDCIQVHFNTVVGTSLCQFYDAAWAASVNVDYWYSMQYCVFTNVTLAHIEGGAIPQYTENEAANLTDWWLRRELDFVDYLDDVIRLKYTVSGGTWTPQAILALGTPTIQPATPAN